MNSRLCLVVVVVVVVGKQAHISYVVSTYVCMHVKHMKLRAAQQTSLFARFSIHSNGAHIIFTSKCECMLVCGARTFVFTHNTHTNIYFLRAEPFALESKNTVRREEQQRKRENEKRSECMTKLNLNWMLKATHTHTHSYTL